MSKPMTMTMDALVAMLIQEPAYHEVRMADDRSQVNALRENLHSWEIVTGCDEFGCDGVYSYASPADAAVAILKWSGNVGTEPEGWIRHMPSGRRRPNGDATREEVRP